MRGVRILLWAIIISIAGMQSQAFAGKLGSRAHKYFANTVLAIATVCLSCSQAPQPAPQPKEQAQVSQHDDTHTVAIELLDTNPQLHELIPPVIGDSQITLLGLVASDASTTIGNLSQTENIYTITVNDEVPIVLTFDDGPDTRSGRVNGTRRVLDTLADFDFNAVFFIQTHARSKNGLYYRGKHASVGTPLVERMHTDGHIIAAHTGMDAWGAHAMANNHVRREATGKLGSDLERSKAFITAITGENPKFVRPPFGIQNRAVRARYAKHDLKIILWDVDSRDTRRGYEREDITKHLAARVKTLARAGNELVVLFHDIDYHTYDADNLAVYIKTIEQSINAKSLTANFKLSKQEIEDTLLD
ncbi:MAG: polysaccharide deacetylase family protein [Pseudomonadota bacterium]|nr:polysaccharide deacetylase family protein [Pseudomonadota bacterium]